MNVKIRRPEEPITPKPDPGPVTADEVRKLLYAIIRGRDSGIDQRIRAVELLMRVEKSVKEDAFLATDSTPTHPEQ